MDYTNWTDIDIDNIDNIDSDAESDTLTLTIPENVDYFSIQVYAIII